MVSMVAMRMVTLFAAVTCMVSASVVEDDAVCLLQRSATHLRSITTNDHFHDEPEAEDGRSLCEDGKLLPELYVLGAQKAATTSFAFDLMHAGVLSAAGGTKKEFHFFDRTNATKFAPKDTFDPPSLPEMASGDTLGIDEDIVELYRKEWMRHLPDCPIDVKKRVSADFTPRNLRLTPLPPGVHHSASGFGKFPNVSNGETRLPDVPRTLRALYGAKSRRVTLVAMLREPAARMLSTWFDDSCNFCRGKEAAGFTFENAIQDILREAQESPPKYADWFWGNMYGHQLESYLEHWPADQLMVLPFLQYVKLNKAAIFERLSARLGISLAYDDSIDYMWTPKKNTTTVSSDLTVASSWNSDPHPKIEEMLSPQVRGEFDAFMAADKRKLLHVLAHAHRSGAWLAGFEGTTESEIQTWLTDSW